MTEHIYAPISRKEITLAYNCDVVYHTFDFHAHDAYEIFYFQKGAVQYYLEDKAYSLVHAAFAGTDQDFQSKDCGDPFQDRGSFRYLQSALAG